MIKPITKKRLRALLEYAEEESSILGNEVTRLWAINTELARVNEELRLKLSSVSHLFGESFVKGGQLPPPKGPQRPNRKKLTDREVKDIRDSYFGGSKQKELADAYGVNPATISRTVRGIYH